ncbi:hypothetical protein CEXT_429231 [Caerostris extrusa]|uniref:Uncharacterized protein n=1 Tax=Caerostris extrusa TaxID=172846 RepID=A0AAV4MU73_CAEEX|nr:hypothetical protein CEXT_429231 [Caerostris extrusa]
MWNRCFDLLIHKLRLISTSSRVYCPLPPRVIIGALSPSCTDTTSGDDTSTLLDFFSNPTGRSHINAGNIRRKLYLSTSNTHTALKQA